MFNDEEILNLFDNYFQNAPKEEIEKDVNYIRSLGFEGVTFDEYVNILNNVTSLSLNEAGICDDITYSDFFNKLIGRIDMGNDESIQVVSNLLRIPCSKDQFENSESLAFAA